MFLILVSGRAGPNQMGSGTDGPPTPKLEEEPKFTCLYQEHQFSFKIFPDDINNK